jgi:hypothetical protein
MSEQEQQREYERYQEWAAEREAHEEQQYHIYLEDRIEELESQLAERQWKKPKDEYTAGILIVEVDMSDGDVCRGIVIQDDEDYNTLLYADDYNDVWTDFTWADIDRYYVLPINRDKSE